MRLNSQGGSGGGPGGPTWFQIVNISSLLYSIEQTYLCDEQLHF